MERIPAARAMEWSIELDKGLRSKHADLRKLALEKIGPRLQQLSLEPNITKPVADIFDLILGEDRLFVNTIILRLCNAFVNGDNRTRSLVLKVFLLELKQLEKNNKGYKGILSKERLANSSEILRMLKSVFYAGGSEEKVLALRILGCMADVAKDSVDIRHLVLSSLKSSDDKEVIAALFVSSCFSLLAEDFACILLRIVPNIITSLRASAAVVLMAVRALSRIRCTFAVATRAYKVGTVLVMNSLEEGLKPEMLTSLTILASKFCMLSSQQVDLLMLLLRKEPSPLVKERSIDCLYFLISRNASCFTARIDDFSVLVNDEVDLPLRCQCKALRVLHKLVCSSIANGTFSEATELLTLIQIMERTSHSPGKKQILSLQVLVGIACNLQNKIPGGNNNNLAMLHHSVTKIIFDQIMSRAEKFSDTSKELSEMDSTEFRTLLGFSLKISRKNPSSGLLAIEKALSVMDVLKKCSADTVRNLLSMIFRFLSISLAEISMDIGVNLDLYPKLKTLVESLQENSFERFLLSINVCGTKHNCGPMPSNRMLRICTEIKALRLVKKLITEGSYWDAYRIGIYSCCEGLWFCSDFIFKKLVGVLNVDVYNSWFKFLSLYSASETEIRLLLFPKPCLRLVQELERGVNSSEEDIVSCEDMDNDDENVDWSVNFRTLEEKLPRVCEMLHSLDQILVLNYEIYFQRWFASLRMRFLESVIDLIRIINRRESGNGDLKDLLVDMFSCTMKLSHLAKEYDLIAISYLETDSKSIGIISSFALVCSLLALCTGVVLAFLPQEDGTSFSIVPYLEDLFLRLHGSVTEATPHCKELLPPDSELISLLGSFHERKDDKVNSGTFHRDCQSLCEFTLSGLVQLRGSLAKESVKDGNRLTFLSKGVDFLSEVLPNCIGLNLRLPKCFFKIRPSIGVELFMFNSGLQSENKISISHGSHLSLNLCIQLKNVANNTLSSINEVHCIVSVSPTQTFSSHGAIKFDPSVTKEMVALNSELFQYVKIISRGTQSVNTDESEVGSVKTFASFEINGRGQGFGYCLMDVSNFEEGLYQIKWHSGFVNENGDYWSLLPLNAGAVFSIKKTEQKCP